MIDGCELLLGCREGMVAVHLSVWHVHDHLSRGGFLFSKVFGLVVAASSSPVPSRRLIRSLVMWPLFASGALVSSGRECFAAFARHSSCNVRWIATWSLLASCDLLQTSFD